MGWRYSQLFLTVVGKSMGQWDLRSCGKIQFTVIWNFNNNIITVLCLDILQINVLKHIFHKYVTYNII